MGFFRRKKKEIFAIISILGWITFFCNLYITYSNKNEKKITKENLTNVVKKLQISYNEFKLMNGKQLHDVWNQLFFNSKYKINGKMLKDEYDCSSAETTFWKALGGNVEYENTEAKEIRFKRVCKKIKLIKQIKHGDIIIFKKNKSGIGHIGIIEKIYKNKIRYMDVNVKDNGQGFNSIYFGDWKISGIYSMNFDYWSGNILQEIE